MLVSSEPFKYIQYLYLFPWNDLILHTFIQDEEQNFIKQSGLLVTFDT